MCCTTTDVILYFILYFKVNLDIISIAFLDKLVKMFKKTFFRILIAYYKLFIIIIQ